MLRAAKKDVDIPGRKTVQAKAAAEFTKRRDRVIAKIASTPNKISLTADAWTSNRNKGESQKSSSIELICILQLFW